MKKKMIIFATLIFIFVILILIMSNSKFFEEVYYNAKIKLYGIPISEDGTINNSFFSIKSDGTDADATTKGINEAIEYAKKNNIEYIKLMKGIYLIDGISKSTIYDETATKKGIIMMSNITFDLNGSTLKHIKNSAVNYAVISITDESNVKVCNGKIEGDRYEHDYESRKSTHEWGFGIDIKGSNQVEIVNVQIEKTTGDGIMIGDYVINGKVAENINVSNCNINDCRRQGISITSGKNIKIYQNEIFGIYGTEPQSGIDIEPYANLQEVSNVIISENIFYDFGTGRAISILGNSHEISVENNLIQNGNIISSSFTGKIFIDNNKIYKGQIWICESQIKNLEDRTEIIAIRNNDIKETDITLVNLPNAILINNKISDCKTIIASSNVAIKNNLFTTTDKQDYALEYFLINSIETQKYNLFIYGNLYEGEYTKDENITEDNSFLEIHNSEQLTDIFINKLIGDKNR